MVNGEKETTKLGNLKRPGLVLVCEWVIKAWESIPSEMVMKSFLKCSISNSMDGSDDDELFSEFLSGQLSDDAPSSTSMVECESESDDDEMYDPALTMEMCEQLFGNESDESFEGFDERDV